MEELTEFVKANPTLQITVDVERLSVEVVEKNWERTFTLDTMTRERLLNGWDDIGITLRREGEITSYEKTSHAPTLTGIFDASGHAQR